MLVIPEWVSLVESKAGIDNHCHPKSNEEDEEHQIPAFPVVFYDPIAQLTISIAAWASPYDSPQWTPHFSPLSIYLSLYVYIPLYASAPKRRE